MSNPTPADVGQLDPARRAQGGSDGTTRLVSAVPDAVARFNRRVINPIVRPVAGHLPGMAIVCHTGRRSGRSFETPVRVFGTGGTFYVMVLAERVPDWVRNLQTAGGGSLRIGGRSLEVGPPRLTDDAEALAAASAYQRCWRRLVGAGTTYVALEWT